MVINRINNTVEFKIVEDQVLMFLDAGLTIVKNGDSILARSPDLCFLSANPVEGSNWEIDSAICLLIPSFGIPIIISMYKIDGVYSYNITKISNETFATVLGDCEV